MDVPVGGSRHQFGEIDGKKTGTHVLHQMVAGGLCYNPRLKRIDRFNPRGSDDALGQ
jgi:hypothetical protein